jgi:hypothetical protein
MKILEMQGTKILVYKKTEKYQTEAKILCKKFYVFMHACIHAILYFMKFWPKYKDDDRDQFILQQSLLCICCW